MTWFAVFASNPLDTEVRVTEVAFVIVSMVAVGVVLPDKKITSPCEKSDSKSVPIPATTDVEAALMVLPVIP